MDKKMKLIERLVKDGSIDLSEALMLLDKDIVAMEPIADVYPPFRTSPIMPTWQHPHYTNGTNVVTSENKTYSADSLNGNSRMILDDGRTQKTFTN